MTQFLFDPGPWPAVPIEGSDQLYPVRRIFCVGRNYAAHAAEMGGEVDREAPWYFTKSAHALCQTGRTIPYPPGTGNYHYEMEFVIALSGPAFRVTKDEAASKIWGYAAGFDMTRRDRQADAKETRRPWSLGKDFEDAAVIGTLTSAADFGQVTNQRIHLEVNGETRQEAPLSDMVWSCEEIISHLSGYYHLERGDLIYTGTPAGVGPVQAGDVLTGGVEGLSPVTLTVSDAE